MFIGFVLLGLVSLVIVFVIIEGEFIVVCLVMGIVVVMIIFGLIVLVFWFFEDDGFWVCGMVFIIIVGLVGLLIGLIFGGLVLVIVLW